MRAPSQFGPKSIRLGTYELEEDAARAYDKVARILGRSGLNFPNSDALEIHGPRSEGADKGVAAAVEAARAFVAKAAQKVRPRVRYGERRIRPVRTSRWFGYKINKTLDRLGPLH